MQGRRSIKHCYCWHQIFETWFIDCEYKRQLTQLNKERFVLYTAQNQTETPYSYSLYQIIIKSNN